MFCRPLYIVKILKSYGLRAKRSIDALFSRGSLQTVTEVSNILVNILKNFDALVLLETSIDNEAEENDVLWLNDVFASLDNIICADTNIAYCVSGYV